MQVEEKKKEQDFLKELEHEQARIWNIDVQKYNEDSKMIDNKYKMMKKKNFEMHYFYKIFYFYYPHLHQILNYFSFFSF